MAVTAGMADGMTFSMLSSFLCYENMDSKSRGLCLEVHVKLDEILIVVHNTYGFEGKEILASINFLIVVLHSDLLSKL